LFCWTSPESSLTHCCSNTAFRLHSTRITSQEPRSGAKVSHTVLICDDAIFMRTMVGDILQQAGFEIVGEAETGLQAVEKYKQLRPDLVTMDIVMPDMGGIDAVREITRFDPQAKILMCSAMGQQALVVEAIQAGARDFVVKPFQPSRVLEAVPRVLA
jgi:two-component system, chemotaxis family, chemotaxis protein CheY